MRSTGKLYVFEGPDSVGKSTLSKLFADYLGRVGEECVYLAFPGNDNGTVGSLIYKIHHCPQDLGISEPSYAALQMLHVAAHIDAIQSKIIPALSAGKSVVLDRFWWSTIVYGKLGGLNESLLGLIIAPEDYIWAGNHPDAVFLLERKRPFEFPASKDWKKCATLYLELAAIQEIRHRVIRISNEGSIDDALAFALRNRAL
ncbi:dTMP kinase [Delftia acidovorans]